MEQNKNKKKIVAELERWDGTIETREIERAWIDDIVFAIQAQYTIVNKQIGLCVKGADYCHVDIYEVEDDIN